MPSMPREIVHHISLFCKLQNRSILDASSNQTNPQRNTLDSEKSYFPFRKTDDFHTHLELFMTYFFHSNASDEIQKDLNDVNNDKNFPNDNVMYHKFSRC